MSSASTHAASPKTCASPGRVRHNPYGSSSFGGSPSGTPVDMARQQSASLSESFASVPPNTPPMAVAPVAWPRHDVPGTPPEAAPLSFPGPMDAPQPQPQQQYYGGGMDVPMPMAGFAPVAMPAYDSVDPAVAIELYSAASAAANAAAAGGMPQAHVAAPTTTSSRGRRNDASQPPRFEELEALQGTLAEHARTATGSSFIQSAIKDSPDPRCLELVWAELSQSLGDLLLDAHGCYVIKSLLERLPPAEVSFVLGSIAADEQLGFSVCTHSLHTRRVVQHIIEHVDGSFLCDLMARHCCEVAMTQQGCIVMQRAMDNAPPCPARDALFESVTANLVAFAKDPFANYVVQHLMEVGERVETAGAMWKAFRGRIAELACNKFASNVIEKCLFHCTAEVQHEMLVEMYSVGPQVLFSMLQDSFGNYIIQSSIALATFRDVAFIDECLRPVLGHTPYGHKIEARLERRLKGKPVTARASAPAPQQSSQQSSRRGRGKQQQSHAVPSGETAW